MKKYLLLLVCCVMLGLTGCSSRKIVGTWNVTYYVTNGEEVTLESLGTTDDTLVEQTLVFFEDGTGTLGEYIPFTWVKDGSTITITRAYPNLTSETKTVVYELDGKELKFYEKPEDKNNYTVYTKRDLVLTTEGAE